MINFFAIFSFFYILMLNVGLVVGIIIAYRKKKRALNDLEKMSKDFKERFKNICE